MCYSHFDLPCETEVFATTQSAEQQPANKSMQCVPPPPARFYRRQLGAAKEGCRTTTAAPASEASLIQTMRRNICAAIIVHELSDCEGDRAHADLWAAVDESFLQ